ncbi:MAG TPA: DeoR/GlpR family DNA-binding transcription regulator [Candidatus Sumerlaeota bacterium]|nr:DeoR/GlpR family DNA-binding transcription regulator [Candidatus Sumerlaeota bacterium]HOR27483.1 DeoR/GlpR family DNA-binding transcription regulator [Candidatus Sumerlaeota bacterium]
MSLNTKQRRDQILARLYEAGQVQVKALASLMDVSEATVRRDLRSLADEGHAELFYGGATIPQNSDFSFRSKALRNPEAKRIVGRLAAALVEDGETIFLDGGTTIYEMAHHLRRKRGLSVIANSIRLAAELGSAEGVNLISIGGKYRPDRMDTVGPLAISTLEQLRGYLAFIGSDGLSRDFGITASDIDSAHLHRLAIHNAREAILVLDHTKLRRPSLYRICEFSEISRIVIDSEPPVEWREFFNDLGIEMIFPGREPGPAAKGEPA